MNILHLFSMKTVNCNSENTCKGVLHNCCKYCDIQGQVSHKDDVCKNRKGKGDHRIWLYWH